MLQLSRTQRVLLSSSLSVFLVGCGSPQYSQSEMHMTVEEVDSNQPIKPNQVPALVKSSAILPELADDTISSDTYDVVVTNVPVRDLLFALARDAGINMDIDDRVSGFVSLSALDQTLAAILARINKQVALRIERVGDAWVVLPDQPYHKQYVVDFINITRSYTSSASTAGIANVGSSSVSNSAASGFWASLETSLSAILGVAAGGASVSAATIDGADNAAEVAGAEFVIDRPTSFSLDQDTGILIVYAPDALHKEVQQLLDGMIEIAKRQVLLEATVVEVVLNNRYSQGVDWSAFSALASEGISIYQGLNSVGGPVTALQLVTEAFSGTFGFEDHGFRSEQEAFDYFKTTLDGQEYLRLIGGEHNDLRQRFTFTPPEIQDDGTFGGGAFTIDVEGTILSPGQTATTGGGLVPRSSTDGFFTGTFRLGDLSAAVQLLDTFGDAKVLSSPRISALNHQPALLRVVDQEIYFSVDVEETLNPDTGSPISRTVSVSENVVDVGFSMNVFPHIGHDGEIILNLRPAVTRVIDYVDVPSSSSGEDGVSSSANRVPVTRVRELESLISIRDGEVAVLGGLLEDRTTDSSTAVPGLSALPGIGKLFQNTNEQTFKTEFIVFLRAKVVTNPTLHGDYAEFKHLLPDSDFIYRDTSDTVVPPRQQRTR